MKNIFIILLLIFTAHLSFGQGLIFDDKAYDRGPAKPQIYRGVNIILPSKASLKEFSPRAGNQLDYATSVAWAIGWAGKTILYAKNRNLSGSDVLPHIFSPAFIYQAANPDDNNCSEGISLEQGLKVVKNIGVPKLDDYLYFCNGPMTENDKEKAKDYKIDEFAKLFNSDAKAEDKIKSLKTSIHSGYPVVIGMIATPSFKRAKEFWQPTEAPDGNHPGQAVCVVGYDDNKYGGAFEVLNSWGKGWGNDGYMWIRYKDFNDYVKYAYEMFDLPSYDTEIAGSLDFKMSTDAQMPVTMLEEGYYRMKQSYKEGDSFRVYVKNEDPGFLYVFGTDLTNNFFQLFPQNPNISAALNYSASSIAIPSPTHYIQFDNTAGTDYLCVLYSREELDIAGIMKKLENASGSVIQKVHKVLDDKLLNKEMEWAADQVKFKGDAKKGNLVAVIVEVNHY
ncbi:MAG: C1 family peptidase [Candidatus Cyclobacteriaceae bacterium M2_1C_046]